MNFVVLVIFRDGRGWCWKGEVQASGSDRETRTSLAYFIKWGLGDFSYPLCLTLHWERTDYRKQHQQQYTTTMLTTIYDYIQQCTTNIMQYTIYNTLHTAHCDIEI
jgi:hypothetical protein